MMFITAKSVCLVLALFVLGVTCEGDENVIIEPPLNATVSPPVDDGWRGGWGEWGNCSLPCGWGQQQRTRSCSRPIYRPEPNVTALPCEGNTVEWKYCNPHPCPVHGNWGPWGQLSSCSATCGDGEVIRARECNNPAPRHKGMPCTGHQTEAYHCILPACKPAGSADISQFAAIRSKMDAWIQ